MANGRLEGQLLVKGDILKGGNSNVVSFSRTYIVPPESGDTTFAVESVGWWEL